MCHISFAIQSKYQLGGKSRFLCSRGKLGYLEGNQTLGTYKTVIQIYVVSFFFLQKMHLGSQIYSAPFDLFSYIYIFN